MDQASILMSIPSRQRFRLPSDRFPLISRNEASRGGPPVPPLFYCADLRPRQIRNDCCYHRRIASRAVKLPDLQPAFLGFTGITWAALAGHVLFAIVAAMVVRWREG